MNQAGFLPTAGVFYTTLMELAYDGYGTPWPLGQTLQTSGAGGISPLNQLQQGLPSTSGYQISSLTRCFVSSCCKIRSHRAELALGSYFGRCRCWRDAESERKGLLRFQPYLGWEN